MTVVTAARTTDEFVDVAHRMYEHIRSRSVPNTGHSKDKWPLAFEGPVINEMRRMLPEYDYPTLRRMSKDVYAFLRATGAMRCIISGREQVVWGVADVWPFSLVRIKQAFTNYSLPQPNPDYKPKAAAAVKTKTKRRKKRAPTGKSALIFDTMKGKGWVSATTIANELDLNVNGTSALICQLANRGHIKRMPVKPNEHSKARVLYCRADEVAGLGEGQAPKLATGGVIVNVHSNRSSRSREVLEAELRIARLELELLRQP